MTPARHAQIMATFDRAVQLEAHAQQTFLDELGESDPELQGEVKSLLRFDASDAPLTPLTLVDTRSSGAAQSSCCPTPLPEHIGRFEILDVLGTGGMGIVYRARQSDPERIVALKIIRPDLASATFRRRFQLEMETLARLRHPGIAAIYEGGTVETATGAQPYIAMEYVPGPPLLRYAAEHSLDLRARIELLSHVCTAVEHAHQRSVIHRDLKPANILVEEVDGRAQPRILDFGVARLTTADNAASLGTLPGQLLGTLAYMSPEQVDGNPQNIDTRCDVYAFGAVGYELLCGQLPIDVASSSLHAGMHAVLDQPVKSLATHGRQFRGDISRVISKALAKEREQRYGSAAALSADLNNILEHRPITARRPSAAYVLAKLVQRHRLAAAALVIGAVLGAAGLVRAHVTQRALQAHYVETRDIAGFLAREFTDKLDEIGGTQEVRRDLLERLRAHIERLLLQDAQDLKLQAAHADVLKDLSDVEFAAGQQERALELREQALAEQQRLAAASPQDLNRQADVSIGLVLVGDILHVRRDFPRTLALYEQALAIDEALVQRDPDSHRFQSNLVWSYMRLAHVAFEQGDLDGANRRAAREAQSLDTILARRPDDIDALHARVRLHQFCADLAVSEGKSAVAVAQWTDAFNLARRLLKEAPTNHAYQRDCASALLSFGLRALDQRDLAAAEECAREAKTILERLTLLDPRDQETRRILSGVCWHSSRVALARGDVATAAAHADEACALAEQLVTDNPGIMLYQRRLMQVEVHRAHVALKQNDAAAVREHAQRAADSCHQLARDPGTSSLDAVGYAETLLDLPIAELQDPEFAREVAQRVLRETSDQCFQAWVLLARYHWICGVPVQTRECYEQAHARLPVGAVAWRDRIEAALNRLPVAPQDETGETATPGDQPGGDPQDEH